MDEPKNVLPDSEGTKSDVTLASSPAVREDVKPQEAPVKAEAEQKGEKTPERNLVAALEEERRLRRELESRLKEAQATPKVAAPEVEDDDFSDEGRLLKQQLDTVNAEMRSLRESLEIEKVHSLHPELKDVSTEFDEFRREYPGISLEKVAKLFLAEKGIVKSERKGLEQPSGGSKTAPSASLTQDDVKRIRENSPRKYIQLLRTGQLNPDNIK